MKKKGSVDEKIIWVDPKTLVESENNPNKHSREQLERLSQIIVYQNWRHPIILRKETGKVIAGHGRLQAALLKSWDSVPVQTQSFESDEQAYAFMVSDNSIASWAELDFSAINLEIPNLGPDFDINLLGIQNFYIDAADKEGDWNGMPEFTQNDKTAFKSIVVHFHNQEGYEAFARLVQQNMTDKTRMIWFPEIIIGRIADKRYSTE